MIAPVLRFVTRASDKQSNQTAAEHSTRRAALPLSLNACGGQMSPLSPVARVNATRKKSNAKAGHQTREVSRWRSDVEENDVRIKRLNSPLQFAVGCFPLIFFINGVRVRLTTARMRERITSCRGLRTASLCGRNLFANVFYSCVFAHAGQDCSAMACSRFDCGLKCKIKRPACC